MARLVWFVLTDGRSFVLSSEDAVEQIPANAVRDFVVFESKAKLPAATAIYRIVRV